ncbi:hypothetical protein CN378_10930 [Bacillus sp. AFS015802]|uniref:DUF6241 domain-containing protein n=1 Tax=Bacillus sp. AFS015802 TaxID=2033486 RepID=UPI000BFA38CD|nr:DUF6241 domain-containing protein [Bacillus sp. AFS015802]PFA67352.1 hypothetical protein CN378_10930 [Bacillus sp. AFS015802]
MKRKNVGIIVCSVLLVTAIGVYIALGSLETTPFNEGGSVSTAGVETDSTQNISMDENPFNEKVKTPLREKVIQQYIHAMSHQKVKAEEKWSFYEITDERIEFLLSELKVNNYKYEPTYEKILTRWKNGDFSEAVSDHNAIWRIQDGNVGIATDLLSSKEEKTYMESRKKESR